MSVVRVVRAVRRSSPRTAVGIILAAAIIGVAVPSAYVGDSFLRIPGIEGGWRGEPYKNWVRVESNYWNADPARGSARRSRDRTRFSVSTAPPVGPDGLVIAIDKRSPALAPMMDRCHDKTTIPEMIYAESSERTRPGGEIGSRPADIPEYFEYKLTRVQLSDCPVVAEATSQAFFVSFDDIHWLNFENTERKAAALGPAVLPPVTSSGKTKSFIVTWFGVAHDVSDGQCPTLNKRPTEDDYYALMSKEGAAKERAALASRGGAVGYEDEQMAFRGPHQLNACMLPGITRDPGHAAPQTTLARGFDLDGDDGTGAPPAGVCKHKNYASADGRSGIDNQLYTVQGCMPGYQGHKGFLMQYLNEQRRNGRSSILIMVSGIDDEQRDDSVDVTVLYSLDPMAKNAAGSRILADYTFRVADNPEYTHYFTRMHGRIVDGVVVTDPVEQLRFNPGGQSGETTFLHAQMRLEFMPDGSMKGIVGGYQDWKALMVPESNLENLYGFQCPAFYAALKRASDGLQNPITGECDGISAAYDIEGVPAFVPAAQYNTFLGKVMAPGRGTGRGTP